MQPLDASQAFAPEVVGKILAGKYRVERVLGRGGMGFVVEAMHLELGEPRAIKFLMPQAIKDERSVERFLREARAAARLKSQHVATVYDVGRLDDAPYMVLEFLDGLPFDALLRLQGALPCGEVCALMMQAMEAIDEAHAHGIVHRDLKPANLFLARGLKDRPTVKVLDFGISKLLTSSNDMALTGTTTLLGSPLYMSPEQMMAARNIDERTDIWSLGVILYQLITGHVPFKGETITQQGVMVVSHPAPPPSQFQPNIPGSLEGAIMRCLEKKREDRFGSVEELMNAIAPFATILPGLPTSTDVDRPSEDPQPTSQKLKSSSDPVITPQGTISLDTEDSLEVHRPGGKDHDRPSKPTPDADSALQRSSSPAALPPTDNLVSPSDTAPLSEPDYLLSRNVPKDTLQLADIPATTAATSSSGSIQSTHATWGTTADESDGKTTPKRTWIAAAIIGCCLFGGVGYFLFNSDGSIHHGTVSPPGTAQLDETLIEPPEESTAESPATSPTTRSLTTETAPVEAAASSSSTAALGPSVSASTTAKPLTTTALTGAPTPLPRPPQNPAVNPAPKLPPAPASLPKPIAKPRPQSADPFD